MALLLEAGNLFAFSLPSSPPHKLFFPHFNLSFSYSLSFSHCTRTRARALNSTSITQFLRTSSKSSGCVSRDPRTSCSDPWGDSNSVEVVVIGSRKDALLDFCLESSFESAASIRFWTIHMRDSVKVQLLQRSLGTDMLLKNVEVPLLVQSCPQAVVLVATAGYGSDDTTAVELLGAVKSADGLGVAIVLKPFGFEGQRRQNEVEDLVKILQEHRIFYIVVDTDALLKKEVVTLAEALSSAHTAILLAINAIVVLMCEMHPKILDSPNVKWKETKVSEILTVSFSPNQ